MRAIEVWVPEGPALMVRLCHQLALECEELPRPFHRQVTALPPDTPIPDWGTHSLPADAPSMLQVLVPGGHHISLPYEFLVPCLCIEVGCPPCSHQSLFVCPHRRGEGISCPDHPALLPQASYSHHDSPRSKHCPFHDQPDACECLWGGELCSRGVPQCLPTPLMRHPTDGPELWSSVRFHDYSTSSKDQMAMVLSASCPLRPRATLCWREAADEATPCHDIPNSTASEDEQVRLPILRCHRMWDHATGWGIHWISGSL